MFKRLLGIFGALALLVSFIPLHQVSAVDWVGGLIGKAQSYDGGDVITTPAINIGTNQLTFESLAATGLV